MQTKDELMRKRIWIIPVWSNKHWFCVVNHIYTHPNSSTHIHTCYIQPNRDESITYADCELKSTDSVFFGFTWSTSPLCLRIIEVCTFIYTENSAKILIMVIMCIYFNYAVYREMAEYVFEERNSRTWNTETTLVYTNLT